MECHGSPAESICYQSDSANPRDLKDHPTAAPLFQDYSIFSYPINSGQGPRKCVLRLNLAEKEVKQGKRSSNLPREKTRLRLENKRDNSTTVCVDKHR